MGTVRLRWLSLIHAVIAKVHDLDDMFAWRPTPDAASPGATVAGD
jgi:hypothetical protein